MKRVKLLNNLILEWENEKYPPPLQSLLENTYACDVCPIFKYCEGNNEHHCQTDGMFSGFYFDKDDALKMENLLEEDEDKANNGNK